MLVSEGPWEKNRGGCAQEAHFNPRPEEGHQLFLFSLYIVPHAPHYSLPDPEQWLSEVISGSKDRLRMFQSLTRLIQPLVDPLIQLNTA